MVAFVSAGLGLGHKDFDDYRGRLRSTRVLWWLQGEPNNQLNVCTASVTEGEVARVKLVKAPQ